MLANYPGGVLLRPSSLVSIFLVVFSTAVVAQDLVERGSRIRYTRCTPICNSEIGTLVGTGQGNTSVVIHGGETVGIIELPFAAISQLEVSTGRSRDREKGAVIGGVVLGGLGFLFMRGAGAPCDGDFGLFCGRSTFERVGGVFLAAATGATIGFFAAPASEQWEAITPQQINPNVPLGSLDIWNLGLEVSF